jgi:hypothetical protein
MENQDLQVFNQTVVYDENSSIFVQPFCDFFGINVQNQLRMIQNDTILSSQGIKKSSDFIFNDKRQRMCLTKKGFIRWIQLINPNIVKAEVREKLIMYQSMVFDFIYGEAIVPNIKRQYEIDIRKKEINKQINVLMSEHKGLDVEQKQISKRNYAQLGLEFPDENTKSHQLKTFHQKESQEICS